MNINKAPALDYSEDISETNTQDIEESLQTMGEQLNQLEGKKAELENDLDTINGTIDQFKDTMELLDNETKAPGELAGSLYREKSSGFLRGLQKIALNGKNREDIVAKLEYYLDKNDPDLVAGALGRPLAGENYERLSPYFHTEELLPLIDSEGIANHLDSILSSNVEPKEIIDRLSPYQIISRYDTLEKNGIKLDINDYFTSFTLPHELIARNIDYLIERGAKFDSLLHKLDEDEVVSNIDKLMKMDGASVEETEKRLLIHNPSPSLAQKYMEALQPYR